MGIVTDKNTIYVDELIRENARLTIQHETDLLRADQLAAEPEEAKAAVPSAQETLEACGCAQDRTRIAEAKLEKLETALRKALADLYFVMAGGDPCKVCAVKCAFGEGGCKPVWRGETGADQ